MNNNILLLFLLAGLFGTICLMAKNAGNGIDKYVIYYGSDAKASDFKDFKLIVFDSEYTKLVETLIRENKIVLAYLSLGEVNSSREYFPVVKKEGLLLPENPNWKGAHLVDIRKDYWQKFVVNELVPGILERGFDGIFLDTLDSPLELERSKPREFAEMKSAAIRLIKSIREEYPDIKIMLNRAYSIAPEVAGDINYLLGESVYHTYDFAGKKFVPVDKKLYQQQVKLLKEVKRVNPKVKIMTLDYCPPGNESLYNEIMSRQKANGFIPFVSTTVKLDIPSGRKPRKSNVK